MAEQLEVLPEIQVSAPGGGGYQPSFDLANPYDNSLAQQYYDALRQHGATEAFAPPMAPPAPPPAPVLDPLLPEVTVTAPKAPAPRAPVAPVITPAAGALVPLVPVATIVAAGIELALEQFRRPAPEPTRTLVPKVQLDVLPEVMVTATRVPPPRPPRGSPIAMPGDPWPFNLDPLEYYPELPGQRPFVPDFGGGVEPRPTTPRVGTDRQPEATPGAPQLDPFRVPTPAARPGAPSPDIRVAPDPIARPVDQPFGSVELAPVEWFAPENKPREPTLDPFPFPLPAPVKVPAPTMVPNPTMIPGYDLLPIGVPGIASPLPDAWGVPVGPGLEPLDDPLLARPPTDECSCGGQKKKPKKKRKPRTICYRGTYRETSRSLKKTRGEPIPCT